MKEVESKEPTCLDIWMFRDLAECCIFNPEGLWQVTCSVIGQKIFFVDKQLW